MATIPRQNDVLFGKGTSINSHFGNIQFRSMVECQKPIFFQTKRAEKRLVAENIVNIIQMRGGRFLMEDPNPNPNPIQQKCNRPMEVGKGMMDRENLPQTDSANSSPDIVIDPFILDKAWVHVDKTRAMAKVMHRLREKKTPVVQNQSNSDRAISSRDLTETEKKSPKKNAVVSLSLHAPGNYNNSSENFVASKAQVETNLNLPQHVTNPSRNILVAAVQGQGEQMNETRSEDEKSCSWKKKELEVGSHPIKDIDANRGTNQPRPPDDTFDRFPIPTSTQSTIQSLASNIPFVENFSNAPIPVTIESWIKSALGMPLSSNDYLRGAIKLSSLLTKQLMKLNAAGEITLPDIAVEKVTVFVPPPKRSNQLPDMLAIRGIRFQQGVLAHLSMAQRAQCASSPLSSRAVCVALGDILLEIFSKGRSSSLGITSNSTSNNPSPLGQGDIEFPVRKRTTNNMRGGTVVNSLLLDAGMPTSIRQLVCDLLDAMDEPFPDSALTSLEETMWDLDRMQLNPHQFLFDRTCPRKALDDTCLFQSMGRHLFGREKEIGILMNARESVANHVQNVKGGGPLNMEHSNMLFGHSNVDFYCDAVFLSGYAGSGKSRVAQSLSHACEADGWFVVTCKFDKKDTHIKSLIKGFDHFFGTWASNACSDPAVTKSFHQACSTISSTIDKEGLRQLLEAIPNMGKLFPQIAKETKGHTHDQSTASIDKVGSATKRRMHLFHVLLKSLSSSGRPVLVVYDDIHWADSFESMKEFILDYLNIPCALPFGGGSGHHGLMFVGTFRSNEVSETNGSIIETINSIEKSESVRVTTLAIKELVQTDIAKLLSETLCLPLRYTQELACLVHAKTRGNPFFIIQFLKTIIQNRMLQYSVSSRRWVWDCDMIDMQMISDGVAELLTTRFNQLPLHLMQTAVIASCFGSQVDDSTIELLNIMKQPFPFNMQDALQLSIQEGIMEKAGPIYQFTHDLIQQTIFESVPANERKALHKRIGAILLVSATNDSAIHLLAVDQINSYCQDSILPPEESSQIAGINATAARFAMSESNFDQARPYVDTGIRLLNPNHWEEQYELSLSLYEMSALISCFNGDLEAMSSCLQETISRVKSFEDSLTSSNLLAKLLAATSKFDEAMSNCLLILSALGEDFPQHIDLLTVLNELSVIQTTLASISVEQVKLLPPMRDKSKLNAMKFLSMLCSYSVQAKPMLVPLLSCRMVRITIEHGFCDDAIVGLVTAGFSLFSFTDDIQLGYRVGKVGESLIEASPNRHALWSRLYFELDNTLKAVVEPMQSAVANCPDRYNSAMLTGDISNAMGSLMAHCIGSLHIGSELGALSKSFVACIRQSTRYQQNTALYLAMSAFGACIYLSGRSTDEIEVDGFEAGAIQGLQDLNHIAKRKNHINLLYQNFFNEMSCYFWMGDYVKVVELAQKHKPSGQKRILEIIRTFFEGIASLSLARHTRQPNWRKSGEKALEKMIMWEKISTWNFENMAKLLQAELHYLNGDKESAVVAYKTSIVSAAEHKFTHYQALACELYGRFCLENEMADEGASHLQMALDKYKQWGAMKKVTNMEIFITTLT